MRMVPSPKPPVPTIGERHGQRDSGPPHKPGPIEAACTDSFQSIVLLAAKEMDKRIEDMFKRGKQDDSQPFFGPMCQLESGIRPKIEAEVRRLIHFQKKDRLASSVSAILLDTDGFLQDIRQYIKSIVEGLLQVEPKKQEAHQAYLGKKEELLQLIQWREYKQTFETALSSVDHRLLAAVCLAATKLDFEKMQPNPLTPSLIVAIVQRLTQDIKKDKDPPLKFLMYLLYMLDQTALDEEEKQLIAEQLTETRVVMSDIKGNAPEEADHSTMGQIIENLDAFFG
ncbi:enhancer of mRNA-decapping protein 4-like [Corythoichthys intestinalis]|uniref:enhancer of mRNA-decapping protein 4-like n=1 Tax=Corythoichthys intestinalis TaxID=161448 RepID=UPI0025A60FE2|nr:enhancer of mRNA-decapping protein 4-like [Corythoichthys intestinalis]XP_057690015.1 enhancer of mRNA-decapping protein 4-like [Corythoichthys intestinalis]XP_057690016.1 enhancer of mRNA-decapping protein 4-like [Corythoichthys intestinalis]